MLKEELKQIKKEKENEGLLKKLYDLEIKRKELGSEIRKTKEQIKKNMKKNGSKLKKNGVIVKYIMEEDGFISSLSRENNKPVLNETKAEEILKENGTYYRALETVISIEKLKDMVKKRVLTKTDFKNMLKNKPFRFKFKIERIENEKE
jgi:hypothetical protein